ncbi:hypothetical protein ACH5RR_021916 [Cinchona calisaya]|uniref:Uncharacterized protein n=1 Tax=Cinchona calisaya TaxID=153742 RepID=A0ABD2Z7F8_9GENT
MLQISLVKEGFHQFLEIGFVAVVIGKKGRGIRIPNEIKDPKLLKNGVDSSTVLATVQASDDPIGSLENGVLRPNCSSDTDCTEVEVICDSEEGRVGSGDS